MFLFELIKKKTILESIDIFSINQKEEEEEVQKSR